MKYFIGLVDIVVIYVYKYSNVGRIDDFNRWMENSDEETDVRLW